MDKDERGYDQIRKWIVTDLFGSTNLTENYACGETFKYRGTRFDKYEGEDTRWICLCVYQRGYVSYHGLADFEGGLRLIEELVYV